MCPICLLQVPLAAAPFVFLNHGRKHNNSPSMTNQQRYRSNTQELSFIDSGDPFLHLSLRITANTTDQNLVCSLQRPLIQPTLSWLPGNNNSSYLKEAAKVTCFFFEASSRLCDLLTSPPFLSPTTPKTIVLRSLASTLLTNTIHTQTKCNSSHWVWLTCYVISFC